MILISSCSASASSAFRYVLPGNVQKVILKPKRAWPRSTGWNDSGNWLVSFPSSLPLFQIRASHPSMEARSQSITGHNLISSSKTPSFHRCSYNKGVTTKDFELQSDGMIAPPTIGVDFRQSSQERCPVVWFMEETRKALLNAFEMIVVHLCSKHVQPFAGMPIVVAPLPDNYQAAWHVRFAY